MGNDEGSNFGKSDYSINGKPYRPNLSQFCETKLDPYFKAPKLYTSPDGLYKDGSQAPYVTANVKGVTCDFKDALFLKIISLYWKGFVPIDSYVKCESLSQVHNTLAFKKFAQKVKRFHPNARALPVVLYGDGTCSPTFSFHPFLVELGAMYGRSLTKSLYSELRSIVGFLPKLKTVRYNNKSVPIDKIPKTVSSELRRKVFGKFVDTIIKDFVDNIAGKVFRFPFGDVMFGLFYVKKDHMELATWGRTIGCQVCNEPKQLSIDKDHFRSEACPGKCHTIGSKIDEVAAGADNPELVFVIDALHFLMPPDR